MTDEERRIAVAAIDRIMHMNYPDELDQTERTRRFVEDSQLVAGELLRILSERGG